jgi:hypothetical protein
MAAEDREEYAAPCEEDADAHHLVDASNGYCHRSVGWLLRWQILDHLGDRLVARHSNTR